MSIAQIDVTCTTLFQFFYLRQLLIRAIFNMIRVMYTLAKLAKQWRHRLPLRQQDGQPFLVTVSNVSNDVLLQCYFRYVTFIYFHGGSSFVFHGEDHLHYFMSDINNMTTHLDPVLMGTFPWRHVVRFSRRFSQTRKLFN